MKETEEIKVYRNPDELDLKNFIDKKDQKTKLVTYISGAALSFMILVFAVIAFFMAGNYSLSNFGILIVVISLNAFLGWKIYDILTIKMEFFRAKIVDIKDVTTTYESIEPENKGKKKKFEIFYEFLNSANNIDKESFMILIDKEDYEEIKDEIPNVDSEVPIIYDIKKRKIVGVFIPTLQGYVEGI